MQIVYDTWQTQQHNFDHKNSNKQQDNNDSPQSLCIPLAVGRWMRA